jgi:hypothetical protein
MVKYYPMFPEMKKGLLVFAALLVCCPALLGQSDKSYTDILETRKQLVYSNHANSFVAHILTGRRLWDTNIEFAQLFLDKSPVEGTLVFDGVLFEGIGLQYNLYTQQVVALLETENVERYVTITPEKVSEMSLFGHEFTVVQGDTVMAPGIYEIAYAGVNSSVFIKRTKTKLQTIEDQKINIEYDPVNKYFVRNEFGTFEITRKKKLIEAYHNSDQIISILKKYKVKLSKKNIEQGLVTAISNLESDNAVP